MGSEKQGENGSFLSAAVGVVEGTDETGETGWIGSGLSAWVCGGDDRGIPGPDSSSDADGESVGSESWVG